MSSEQEWSKSWSTLATCMWQLNQILASNSRMFRFRGADRHLFEQQLQQQLQQQIHLRETIQRIRRVLAVSDVHATAVQVLMEFFQADWIFLLENGSRCWQPVNQPLYRSKASSTEALNIYLKLEAVATKLGQPYPIAVDAQSVKKVPGAQDWLSQFPGSWLLIPIYLPHHSQLKAQDKPWGLVAIGRQAAEATWTPDQHAHAKILVEELAIALDHSLLYETVKQDNNDLKSLALTDSLTGLANRRQFDDYFDTEWQRLAREQQPLTLILCDIDYFKRYNDYYGHPTGDICLTTVSKVLTQCIRRPADLVARYGGEEFAVILPNTDTEGGHSVALTIRNQLLDAAVPHATSGVSSKVTLTMGIASIVPKHQLESQKLIQAADLALYHAKQQGRDRIYVNAHYCVPSTEISICNRSATDG
ncbi:MAG: diguanylate cyclase [Symploca sp. SIO2G7]|nr:diguanylate cyclase [Symploca sp. SIO2G7]